MRADRLLSLVLLLQAHGRLSAPVLARRLEVSVRTVLRDVEALSAAGVPVYTSRGRQGGVLLVEGYRIGAAHLTPGEATSLAVGQPELVADLGLGDALDLAMEKIVGAGGGPVRAGVEHGRSRILVDAQQWMRTARPRPVAPGGPRRCQPVPAAAPGLRGQRGPRSAGRPVDPVGLVAKAGIWYLVAVPRSGTGPDDAGNPGVSPVPGRPDPGLRGDGRARRRPGGLGPGEDLDGAARAGRGTPVRTCRSTLAVAPAALPMVRRLLAAQVLEESAAERPELRVGFAGTRHAVAELLRLGTLVEVLAPGDLRVALREAAQQLVDLYDSASPG